LTFQSRKRAGQRSSRARYLATWYASNQYSSTAIRNSSVPGGSRGGEEGAFGEVQLDVEVGEIVGRRDVAGARAGEDHGAHGRVRFGEGQDARE
jgi:hypothetical protein